MTRPQLCAEIADLDEKVRLSRRMLMTFHAESTEWRAELILLVGYEAKLNALIGVREEIDSRSERRTG